MAMKKDILSPREMAIMQLLFDGLTTPEISQVFGCSPATVRAHRTSINRKLGTHTPASTIRRAFELNLVSVQTLVGTVLKEAQ